MCLFVCCRLPDLWCTSDGPLSLVGPCALLWGMSASDIKARVANVLVQTIALIGGVLFVGVRFSFVHAAAGSVGRCTSGDGEEVTGSGSEKKEAVEV